MSNGGDIINPFAKYEGCLARLGDSRSRCRPPMYDVRGVAGTSSCGIMFEVPSTIA